MSENSLRSVLAERITQYLSNGGLFNPEHMEHDKVRALLMDCRDALAATQEPQPCNGAHKFLRKQMVGEQVWYACECGQKFHVELWDGRVSVKAPAPRPELAPTLNGAILSPGELERVARFCTCSGWPKGQHGPHCTAISVRNLLESVLVNRECDEREAPPDPRPELAPALLYTESEEAAIAEMMQILDVSRNAILRGALRHYQLHVKGEPKLPPKRSDWLEHHLHVNPSSDCHLCGATAEREAPPDLAGLAKIIEKLREDAHTLESPYWTHDPAEPDWAYVAKAFREIADELAAQLKVQR